MKNNKLSFYLPGLLSLFVITSICFDCTDASLLNTDRYAPPTDTEYLSIRPAELFTSTQSSEQINHNRLQSQLLRYLDVTFTPDTAPSQVHQDEGLLLLLLELNDSSQGRLFSLGCLRIIYEKKLLNSCYVCVTPGTNF